MYILGIETSCDETSAAIIEGNKNEVRIKSQSIASSLALHAQTGGIIPEIAARQQIRYMLPVLQKAQEEADIPYEDIDAIAVTYGPGLIGSLLVGVETAKTLACLMKKPLIQVNHLVGHIYANWLNMSLRDPPNRRAKQSPTGYKKSRGLPRFARNDKIKFPAIVLVVSGGHTDLLLMRGHGKFELLGGTRDDAAGEAFDKIGRLIGLPYPGGPAIEKAAKIGNSKRFSFPRPLMYDGSLDFSFSGLKTAALRQVKNLNTLDKQTIADIARATQDAVIAVLVEKTLNAAKQYHAKSILLSGGVAANETLREAFSAQSSQLNRKLFAPAKSLCTDNAAMIASAAFYNFDPISWKDLTADPELYFEYR